MLARLSQVRVVTAEGKPPLIHGHVVLRAPVPLVNRFVRVTPLSGSVAFAGDLRWDGTHRLPGVQGKLTGSGIKIGQVALAEKLDGDLSLQDDELRVPHFYMRFADGDVHLYNAHIRPLADGVPLNVEKWKARALLFHSMMRDRTCRRALGALESESTKVPRSRHPEPDQGGRGAGRETNEFELSQKLPSPTRHI